MPKTKTVKSKAKTTKTATAHKTAPAPAAKTVTPVKTWLQPVHYRVTDFKKIGHSMHANAPRYRKTG